MGAPARDPVDDAGVLQHLQALGDRGLRDAPAPRLASPTVAGPLARRPMIARRTGWAIMEAAIELLGHAFVHLMTNNNNPILEARRPHFLISRGPVSWRDPDFRCRGPSP